MDAHVIDALNMTPEALQGIQTSLRTLVSIMRLYTAFIVLQLVVSLPVAAQTAVSKATKAIDTIEDIEIGMAADPVIAGLTKQGYALADDLKSPTGGPAMWNVSFKDKYVGEFAVEHGRVTSVAMKVYTSHDDSGSIDLGEALYWILYDNGQTLPSKDRDWKQTDTYVHITTREIEQRTPGSSWRMIFIDTANGASYRIALDRSEGRSSVFVTKLAPFVKKK
jgi:hypothetical protein